MTTAEVIPTLPEAGSRWMFERDTALLVTLCHWNGEAWIVWCRDLLSHQMVSFDLDSFLAGAETIGG